MSRLRLNHLVLYVIKNINQYEKYDFENQISVIYDINFISYDIAE